VVAHVAVPAAVVELRRQHRLRKRRKSRIAVQEVRAEPEPEAEVAEIDPLEQEGAVDGGTGGHESTQQTLERRPRGRVIFGQAARHEQEERPRRGRPPSLGPFAVPSLVGEKAGDPARLNGSRSLGLPGVDGFVEQIAHRLPAYDRVSGEEPLDDRVVSAAQGCW
jgi:hypothetical protein